MTDDARNRLHQADDGPLRPDSLIGSYFHDNPRETGDDSGTRQGCVIAEPHPGVYLVELFSWMHGDSIDQQLVRIEDMAGWAFYDTAEWMNATYNNTIAPRSRAREKRQQRERKEAQALTGGAP